MTIANTKRYQALIPIGLLTACLWWAACTPEDEVLTQEADVQLSFERDTIQFDTLFTSVGSTTQRLKVYNRQANAVDITSVSLGGTESPFQIIVNGETGEQFQNLRLRGGDSLLLLVDVEIDPKDTDVPFVVRDQIVFRTSGGEQQVVLEAWGQDAYFLSGEIITRNTTFTADRPYVVRDSLWVLPTATLTLAPGTELYFDNRASLLVDGTLRAQGAPDERVVLNHIRNDGNFLDALGQWEGVLFGPESKDNSLNFATIRNANVGVGIASTDNDAIPDVTLANVIIENMAGYGIFTIETDIDLYNTVIINCAQGAIRGIGRAYYRLRHCTILEDDPPYFREDDQPLLAFSPDAESVSTQEFSLQIINTIVAGYLDQELGLDVPKPILLQNTLVNSLDTSSANANLYNQDPMFSGEPGFEYRLDSLSPAVDAGRDIGIPEDIEGNPRDANPDLGAYEFVSEQ